MVKNAVSGYKLVDKMVESIEHDQDIFICPAGISRKDADWKSGIGYVVKGINHNVVGIGFVYIPTNMTVNTKVKFEPVIGSLIKFNNDFHPKEIAAILQNEYNSRK